MVDLRKRFGKLVAAHRRRLGLTQEQLAETACVSIDMISKIETGASGARFPVIERLSAALEIDPAELFTTELPTSANKSAAFNDLASRLAVLNDAELEWAGGVLKAALRSRN